jgi:hypothetical protein
MIYLAALTALVAAGGVGLLSVILKNRWPGKNKISTALEALKKETMAIAGELVPIGKEELEDFSSKQIHRSFKKGMVISAKGAFTTIFHEPLMAYSYKKFLGGSAWQNALLYIMTDKHEFTYWLQKSGTEIFIDGNRVGTFKIDKVLYGAKRKKPLAYVGTPKNELTPIFVYKKEMGSMTTKTTMGKDLGARAFQFLKDDYTREEQLLFLAITGLILVMNGIEQRK